MFGITIIEHTRKVVFYQPVPEIEGELTFLHRKGPQAAGQRDDRCEYN